eukprot:scaffold764_cov248-Pinguiococcus_pyrenoidosus.AAC.26
MVATSSPTLSCKACSNEADCVGGLSTTSGRLSISVDVSCGASSGRASFCDRSLTMISAFATNFSTVSLSRFAPPVSGRIWLPAWSSESRFSPNSPHAMRTTAAMAVASSPSFGLSLWLCPELSGLLSSEASLTGPQSHWAPPQPAQAALMRR